MDVVHNLEILKESINRQWLKSNLSSSGVWRFKELILPIDNKHIITRNEGNTNLYSANNVLKISKYCNIRNLYLKHEGENPTGSFKDRGMTVGISFAKLLNMKTVACASTGNTSASMASYAGLAQLNSVVFIPEGKIAYGKLAQTIAYGAKTLQIEGNFDTAMNIVQEACGKLKLYLLNSVNPIRLEGQKSVIFEILQQLNLEIPDWIVLPGGNLGNNSAVSKALKELLDLGIINKLPRMAVIQAHGANPLYIMWKKKSSYSPIKNPETIATAIKIGNPVNWKKSIRGLKWTNGLVEEVSEQEILDAKAVIDKSGIGCEPASAASIAGAKKLLENGTIDKNEKVVCILTGSLLKDPDIIINYHTKRLNIPNINIKYKYANKPRKVRADLDAIRKELKRVD